MVRSSAGTTDSQLCLVHCALCIQAAGLFSSLLDPGEEETMAEQATEAPAHEPTRTASPIRVAVAGATGYAGQELLRLLAR